jgi:uncharacterized Tic20 family protein
MAALSHFFGWIFATIAYLTHRDKSKFVRFQSLQALVFEGVVLVFTILMTIIVMVLFFILFALVMFMTMNMSMDPNDTAGITLFIISMTLLPMAPMLLMMPPVIFIMVLRIVAGIRSWQGHDFRYPLIGRWVSQWTAD